MKRFSEYLKESWSRQSASLGDAEAHIYNHHTNIGPHKVTVQFAHARKKSLFGNRKPKDFDVAFYVDHSTDKGDVDPKYRQKILRHVAKIVKKFARHHGWQESDDPKKASKFSYSIADRRGSRHKLYKSFFKRLGGKFEERTQRKPDYDRTELIRK